MLAHSKISIVPYQRQYAREISDLYHICVQHIRHERYSELQLNAWSRSPRSAKHWDLRLKRSKAWVLLLTDEISQRNRCIGFINVETVFQRRGYIDSLYIHPDWQRQGWGEQLYRQLELWAKVQGYQRLMTDASYLSKGLFIKMGFTQAQRSYQQKSDQVLVSFYMIKNL
ncbi:GNAT family N-acetyltransferase [Shewanella sp. A25]|nr:GNAT family N-acetyltransferase [Shewanella shenzhenensis]